MSRRVPLSKINEAWELRADGWKYRSMVEPLDVQERQIGNYLNPNWVRRQKDFLELSHTEWADLTPSLQKIHPRYEDYSQRDRWSGRLDPVQQQVLLEKIKEHWAKLNRIIYEELMDLHVLPPDAHPVRHWFAWSTETRWPISQGWAYRTSIGKISVKLNLHEQEVWKPVRQHLEGHPVLGAAEKWQQATARDISARLSLFKALQSHVEAKTRLSVWVSFNEGDIKMDGLHNRYMDILYDQVFRTAVNQGQALSAPIGGPPPLTPDQFPLDPEGNLCHFNDLLLQGCTETEREVALTLLFEAHSSLSDIPEAQVAGRAYHEADTQTNQLRVIRSEFVDSGLDLNTRCEECLPWFQALGIQSKGLGR